MSSNQYLRIAENVGGSEERKGRMSEPMPELDGGIGEFKHTSSFLFVPPMVDQALGIWLSEKSVGNKRSYIR